MSVITETKDYRLILKKVKLTNLPDTYELVFRRELLANGEIFDSNSIVLYMSSGDIEKLKAAL
tara:strand:- start:2641 stop:2829 length:189 start_codon:yes stop_codon:yes gene_type:complete